MLNKKLYALVVAAVLCITATASEYRFTHFNTSNSDLSYDGVSKIFQDSRGFVWIGTFSGLNRYDGTHFKLYRKSELGLDSDFIHTIIEDREGNLWIGTDAGVSRYLWRENRFEPFFMDSDKGTHVRNKVTFLHCGADGRVWIIANYQGCFCYDGRADKLMNFRDGEKRTPEYNTDELSISFRRLVEDGQGGFWVSKYHSNVFHVDSTFKHVTVIDLPYDKDFYKGDEIEQLFMLDGKLLVASNLHGLSRYDPATKRVETLFRVPADATLVDATLQENRWVWLSTTDGVWRYDLSGENSPLHLFNDISDRFSITGDYVWTTCIDRDGGIWIGTKDGGVSYSGESQQIIRKIDAYPGGSLKNAIVSGFAEDGQGRVWITTESSGLFRYDVGTGSLSSVNLSGVGTIEGLCSPVFDDGKLWLGSLSGLWCLDTASLRLKHYGTLLRAGVSDPRVYVIKKTDDGELYFANTLGLFGYNKEGDSFTQIPPFDGVFITSISETPDGLLWMSSYATGLFEWNPVNGELVCNYRFGDGSGLPSDKIASVYTDHSGNVWVSGFSSGFARLENGRFEVYDTETLPSLTTDVFFCVNEDADGNLWLNSDKGLFRFNPETGALNLYREFDGLLDNKLTYSGIVLSSGDMLLGSDNGFVHLNPSSFLPRETPPEVVVSEMYVGKDRFEGNADLMDKIILKPHQNSFGFELSVMSLSFPASNQLRCRLRGLESAWQDVSLQKSVYYYNVPSGTYQLEIQVSISGNTWTFAHNPLTITVKPTFFNSFPGIALIVVIIAAIFLVIVWIIMRRQKAKRVREEEAFRQKTEETLFMDKMNFFSHVVHEIKTPLTLIKTPLQSIISKESLDDEAKHDLKVMQNNADYLSLLVNELLEFVRIERSGYVLNRENIDLTDTIQSLIFNYSDTAINRNILINLDAPGAHVWVSADSPALNKILNNLLINALKYAESRIDISVSCDDGLAKVAISNDGETIPRQFREDIFKPFIQYHKDGTSLHKGVGIGLPLARSLARKHSGDLVLDESRKETTFELTLPSIEAPVETVVTADEDASPEVDSRSVILLVDDNAELREFLSRKLSDDYSVMKIPNAEAATGILRENNVDLVITDISMPGKSGLDLCRDIRSDVEISHVSIIVLSARSSVESKIQAMEAGADLYLEKPFDLDYLRSSLKSLMDRRKLMRDALSSGVGEPDITMFGLPKRDEEFFRTFDTFIKDNLSNPELSNEMLAEALCMSQSTLIRKIRKLLNTSPSNYIRTKRLVAAAKMLKDSHGNNITEICYACGFSNESYFAKCFKEQYGVTPSEYVAQ